MTFLKIIDEATITNLKDLQEFFMTDKVTREMFEDVEKLKNWIEEDTNCIWFSEGQGHKLFIIQYEWDE